MKIVQVVPLISAGSFAKSAEWKHIRSGLHDAVQSVDWPPGSGTFTIHPESGKGRGKGNGVAPIKNECIRHLLDQGWKAEVPLDLATSVQPGDLDAVFQSSAGAVAMEWETGNISSSHRALNKMALGLMKGKLVSASLVVPSKNLARWLTDRIGNFPELEPYLDLWSAIPCANGVRERMDGPKASLPRNHRSDVT